VSGSGGRKWMGRGSVPFGRPRRKLESTDVRLFSDHAEKLTVYGCLFHIDGTWMSSMKGGSMEIIPLINSLPLFNILMSMCPNIGKKTTTFAEVTHNPWNSHKTQKHRVYMYMFAS